jgi:hypothetical protein
VHAGLDDPRSLRHPLILGVAHDLQSLRRTRQRGWL